MSLTSSERRRLRAEAHHLDPVVHVGRDGVSDGVLGEVNRSLEHHELIKVRLAGDRDERSEEARRLAAGVGADLVGTIGSIAILYRPRPADADPEDA